MQIIGFGASKVLLVIWFQFQVNFTNMNYLAINCSVANGYGRVVVVILNNENEVFSHVFKSPSVFSFTENSAEILNWHRDNIISLITQFHIQGVVIKKTEQNQFAKLSKSEIFKLYLEGVMLSLAGSIGVENKHYYKKSIQKILQNQYIFDKSIEEICDSYSLINCFGAIPATELIVTKDTLLAVVSLKITLSQ